ncbi:alpha/beta fold hydrolase [Allosediminivita pacifica]|uniref:Pimeloyl-ACP methyl ester carboxylesterase n=1 Tax=Allosediminivita pacifica TaxID=1267769 RepID=A0A2T6AVH2_9RHOB|nr:alpha/beta hydrolase [Allosediminivita pacifica]PTX47814.1 pimeloyl-ACP methyl ester carboxylesterase [Allosediminivita pacifica]GGB12612.1 hydrolase or acyltransferase (alpha/beta hydrolase) [Allosediminivita pacifica]
MTFKLWIAFSALIVLAGCGALIDQRASRAEAEAERRWPPVGQFVEVDGTPVHFVQAGRGPDLVLIHGAGGNLRDFTFSLMERLAEDYRVTAFDRPGLGYTGRAGARYTGAFNSRAESPQVQADLLAAAAGQLGVESPVVLGHSYGGSVAMAWGLDHEAAALVSVSGAIMPWPGSLGAQYKVLGSSLGGAAVPPFATAFVDPMNTEDVLAGIFAPQSVPEGYLEHVGPGLTLRRETLRANARQVNGLRPHLVEMSKRYEDLQIPVELIHGDADTTVGLEIHSAAAVEVLPDAELTVLPGVGHMPHHAREGAVVEAVHRAARRAGLR